MWLALTLVSGLLLDRVAIVSGFSGECCRHRTQRNARHFPGVVLVLIGSHGASSSAAVDV